ncbi:MAG: hypothetical protein AAF266_11495 [Planctomycetota bacterium]
MFDGLDGFASKKFAENVAASKKGDLIRPRIIEPPSAENPNLALQRGVFTVVLDGTKVEDERETNRDSLDERLLSGDAKRERIGGNPSFWNLHLPIGEAPRLLLLLSQLGYSANRIFDGYRGAAEAVRERASLQAALPDRPVVKFHTVRPTPPDESEQ